MPHPSLAMRVALSPNMYRDRPTRAERAQAIAGVAAIHLALGALALSPSRQVARPDEALPIQVVDLAIPDPPPPPPPPPPRERDAAEREAGAPAKRAEPAPVVAPVPRIELPAKPVIAAAPVAGTGSAPSAGAAAAGSGTGAGGSGTGAGGGGRGDGAGAIGEEAYLLYGGLSRRDYRRLRAFALPAGRAVLDLRVGPDGRVSQCTIRQSSGTPALDAALCALLQPRMQWRPARDRAGRPITVGILYTAVWDRD